MENTPNITQEELELMERFWQGKFVDNKEERQLRERYATDSLWRNKADEARLLVVGIREAALEDKLPGFHRQVAAPVRKTNWLRMGVAACIVGITTLGVLFFFSKSPGERLFSQFYKPDPGLPTLMGVSDSYEFENAMVSYKTGDYQKALYGWQGLRKSNPGNDTLAYFIGSAYLAQGRTDSALTNLNDVIAVPQSVFRSDAAWYLALAWLKQGNKTEAVKALQQSDHADKERLLEKLNK